MYFLSGTTANLQTLLVLAHPHLIQGQPLSESLVARAYRNYLADLQPQVPAPDADRTVLVRDDIQASLLAELFDLPAVDKYSQGATATSMDDSKAAFFTAGWNASRSTTLSSPRFSRLPSSRCSQPRTAQHREV
ncbi:hypothetical protein P3T39_007032 [Kitasatospora sp. GP82]|nr:hypothetical protein [Kitasatospora sp. GP82]